MRSFVTKALLLPAFVGLMVSSSSAATLEDTASKREALETLRDIQLNIVQIAEHAARVEVMALQPGTYDRQTHQHELLRLKNRINDIGDLIPKLQNQAKAPKWQKEIIDDVSGLMKALATQAEKSLKYVNEADSEVELGRNVYQARVAGVRQYAEHIDQLIDYADTRTELKKKAPVAASS